MVIRCNPRNHRLRYHFKAPPAHGERPRITNSTTAMCSSNIASAASRYPVAAFHPCTYPADLRWQRRRLQNAERLPGVRGCPAGDCSEGGELAVDDIEGEYGSFIDPGLIRLARTGVTLTLNLAKTGFFPCGGVWRRPGGCRRCCPMRSLSRWRGAADRLAETLAVEPFSIVRRLDQGLTYIEIDEQTTALRGDIGSV